MVTSVTYMCVALVDNCIAVLVAHLDFETESDTITTLRLLQDNLITMSVRIHK